MSDDRSSADEPSSGAGSGREAPRSPLDGVRVLDCATLFAGPLAATILGDFGAEVVKVEHPRGDPVRDHGHSKDGVNLWWTMLARNKKTVSLALGTPEGADLLRRLVAEADVLIENFRPGTLERWGLSPASLQMVNPRLVVARVTGFGQSGPYSGRPGFGTLAESMSGFAAITGEPAGPPTLPPFGLADGIAAQACASAVLMALYARDRPGGTGTGQVVDLAIIEPILTVLGPQPTVFDQLGVVQERTGNRSVNNAPRNTYRTRDGKWVAISTSAHSVAERVMRLVGRPDLVEQPWFGAGATRAQHADELDAAVGGWIAERDVAEVLERFEQAQAAAAPIYDIRDAMADPQYAALGTFTTVEHERLGPVRMQNLLFRLSDTPGRIRWAGRDVGQDNAEVLGRLGVDASELADLAARGVV